MAKIKVTFRPIRNSDDDWTVIAEYPGAEPREIVGFQEQGRRRRLDERGPQGRVAPLSGIR
jgi:hypothetical protein